MRSGGDEHKYQYFHIQEILKNILLPGSSQGGGTKFIFSLFLEIGR